MTPETVYILSGAWSDYDCHADWVVAVYEDKTEAEDRKSELQMVASQITNAMARDGRGWMKTLLEMDPDAAQHEDIEYFVGTYPFKKRGKP